MSAELKLSRRNLLRSGLAGALVLGVSFGSGRVLGAEGASDATFAPDAFIRIASDGAVTLIMPQVEMGQGIYTALTMLIAEELDLAMNTVKLEAAPPNDALYGNPIFQVQATGGSTSVRAYWVPLRTAGATARAMLVAAAAKGWGVPPETCRTSDGEVLHGPSGRSATYGSLAAAAARQSTPENVALKDPADFKLIGKPHHRLDTPPKVDGRMKYGIDVMPEGVVFATLAASPVPEGKLGSVDESQARDVPGLREVIRFDDMVAVVGNHSWAALRGLDALGLTWDGGRYASLSTASLREGLNRAADGEALVAGETGDAQSMLDERGVIEAQYDLPMLAHAPMEPMNATVHITPGRCEIWVGTQVATMAQRAAAEECGLQPEQVIVHNHLIGGAFGRRLEVDFIRRAVRIARRIEGPVKVFWTREEDITNGMYRSIYGVRMAARLDDGKPVAWRHRVTGPAIIARWLPPAFDGKIDIDAVDGAVDPPYDFPNFRAEYVRHELPGIPTCFWRGVGPNINVFAVESFIDLLARDAGTDPLDFRRSLIGKHTRARGVLDLAAERAGWGGKLPSRTGRGISLALAFGSYICTIAEAEVADDGAVNVKRLVTAVDCGMQVNPDGIISQIEGGHVFGLSAVLHGNITIAEGRVQQSNFHDYRVVRIDEMPTIEVALVKSAEAPGGIGETGCTSVQPAIANAVFAATGIQPKGLPIDRALFAKGARA